MQYLIKTYKYALSTFQAASLFQEENKQHFTFYEILGW